MFIHYSVIDSLHKEETNTKTNKKKFCRRQLVKGFKKESAS